MFSLPIGRPMADKVSKAIKRKIIKKRHEFVLSDDDEPIPPKLN